MGYIIKPPTTDTKKFQTELEHIPQSHFVKKTEKEAITKHPVIEEPKKSVTENVDTLQTFNLTPTSSYNPYTFQQETSYKGVLEAIENGKDTDLVAMPVGEVRRMQERIRILETEVIKSSANYTIKREVQAKLDMERERIKFETQRMESNAKHKHQTELNRAEIKRQIAMSKGWDKMFDS